MGRAGIGRAGDTESEDFPRVKIPCQQLGRFVPLLQGYSYIARLEIAGPFLGWDIYERAPCGRNGQGSSRVRLVKGGIYLKTESCIKLGTR